MRVNKLRDPLAAHRRCARLDMFSGPVRRCSARYTLDMSTTGKIGLTAVISLMVGIGGTLLVPRLSDPERTVRSTAEASRAEPERLEFRMARVERAPPGSERADAPDPNPAGETALEWVRKLFPKKYRTMTVDQLRYMRELDLSRVMLDPEDLEHLRNFPSLAILNLRGSGITDEEAASWPRAPRGGSRIGSLGVLVLGEW